MKSSNIDCDLAEPVLLNCWKHHAGFIRSKIKEYNESGGPHLEGLLNELLHIGESLMDLYLGELTPLQIADTVILYLNKQISVNKTDFQNWLEEMGDDYRTIVLEDTSRWTLRLGDRPERFIHIHPSRYSPYTVRVRSTSLKTVIIYGVIEKPASEGQLIFINRIRNKYLKLPPLKNLKSAHSLFNLIKILT